MLSAFFFYLARFSFFFLWARGSLARPPFFSSRRFLSRSLQPLSLFFHPTDRSQVCMTYVPSLSAIQIYTLDEDRWGITGFFS